MINRRRTRKIKPSMFVQMLQIDKDHGYPLTYGVLCRIFGIPFEAGPRKRLITAKREGSP